MTICHSFGRCVITNWIKSIDSCEYIDHYCIYLRFNCGLNDRINLRDPDNIEHCTVADCKLYLRLNVPTIYVRRHVCHEVAIGFLIWEFRKSSQLVAQ